jgi:adenine-specific DNA methylase
VGPDDRDLQAKLLKFIGEFANWDVSADSTWLSVARSLIGAVYSEEPPLVVDPFAGGGSIPLEALRLGCEAFASDLNPVACIILKAMLEEIPRHGAELSEELRRIGQSLKSDLGSKLAEYYPSESKDTQTIAYLWARTVKCEAPNCGAEIPLVRSFWLCRGKNRKQALRYEVLRPSKGLPFARFEVFEPSADSEVPSATVASAKATCLCCKAVLSSLRVRAQLVAQKGGAETLFDEAGKRIGGAFLLAIVSIKTGQDGRRYRVAQRNDYVPIARAQQRIRLIVNQWEDGPKNGAFPIPNEPINAIRPSPNARGLSAVTRYGIQTFGDLFTARQKLSLVMLAGALREWLETSRLCLPVLLEGRLVDFLVSVARWKAGAECPVQALARQALPMVWDFAEVNPWTEATGSLVGQAARMADSIESCSSITAVGQVEVADAAESPLPSQTASVWFTDPPYYDAIPYADLSDFFFVWLHRVLPRNPLLRDPFDSNNVLTPKLRECVWNQAYEVSGHPKDGKFFEVTIQKCFAEGRRVLREDGICSVVFAHQTTEGWEALLGGLIRAGWTVTGSWPIATEMATRVRARDTASLATSVHLICRPRPLDASIGDWAEVLRELPNRVGVWMERLQREGIRGADLVFACIGPALEIFSRYSSSHFSS